MLLTLLTLSAFIRDAYLIIIYFVLKLKEPTSSNIYKVLAGRLIHFYVPISNVMFVPA